MRNVATYILLIVVFAITCGCDRREIFENYGGNIILDISIAPLDSRDDMRGEDPAGMTASFHDRQTMNNYHTSYLSPNGGFVSMTPGTYHLMVYNYDTEYTLMRSENMFHQAEAYTHEVSPPVRNAFAMLVSALDARSETSRAYADDPVIQEPDHLFVGTIKDVVVPASSYEDEIKHISIQASTILDRYEYSISVIQGMEYVKTAELFVTGQVQSKLLHDRSYTGAPCTLYLPLKIQESDSFTSSFLTFGAYPGQPVYLVLRITNFGDKVAVWEWDVSDQVASGSYRLNVQTTIEVPVAEGSGFSPQVDEWDDIITHITL